MTDHIVLKIREKEDQARVQCPFLGVLMDSTLSWKNHLTELSEKLARTAGIFYKIRHYAPKDTLILLYHAVFALFLSHFVSIWDLSFTEPFFCLLVAFAT